MSSISLNSSFPYRKRLPRQSQQGSLLLRLPLDRCLSLCLSSVPWQKEGGKDPALFPPSPYTEHLLESPGHGSLCSQRGGEDSLPSWPFCGRAGTSFSVAAGGSARPRATAVLPALGTASGGDTAPTAAGLSTATLTQARGQAAVTRGDLMVDLEVISDTWKTLPGDTGADHLTFACSGFSTFLQSSWHCGPQTFLQLPQASAAALSCEQILSFGDNGTSSEAQAVAAISHMAL